MKERQRWRAVTAVMCHSHEHLIITLVPVQGGGENKTMTWSRLWTLGHCLIKKLIFGEFLGGVLLNFCPWRGKKEDNYRNRTTRGKKKTQNIERFFYYSASSGIPFLIETHPRNILKPINILQLKNVTPQAQWGLAESAEMRCLVRFS